MQNQEKNNSFLPSWMCETEQYVPSIDKDGFITKKYAGSSWCTVKIKMERREGRVPKRQSFFKTMLYIPIYFTYCLFKKLCIFINYGRRNYSCTCNLSDRNNETDTSGTFGAVLFSALILLPAVFIGNPQILLIITTKVFVSVTLIGILSAGTSWNKLTASLRSFHIPDIFIFTLDITLKYIAVLGEICMEILTSLRLRSVGQNRKKHSPFLGYWGFPF